MQDSAAPDAVEQADSAVMVRRVLLTLSPREERAVRLRHFSGLTYEEVGDQLDIGPQRARQIVEKAMHKLKHPSRSRMLRAALDGALPRASYPPIAPKPTPTDAQEMARRLRELAAHIEDTKRREAQHAAWQAEYRARQSAFTIWALENAERHARWRQEDAERQAAREAAAAAAHARGLELRALAKSNPRLGDMQLFVRLRRNVNIGSGDTAIHMAAGEIWLVGQFWWERLIGDGHAEDAE